MTAAVGRETRPSSRSSWSTATAGSRWIRRASMARTSPSSRPESWKRVKADTYSLDITFVLNGPKGEVRVTRECDKKGVSEGLLKVIRPMTRRDLRRRRTDRLAVLAGISLSSSDSGWSLPPKLIVLFGLLFIAAAAVRLGLDWLRYPLLISRHRIPRLLRGKLSLPERLAPEHPALPLAIESGGDRDLSAGDRRSPGRHLRLRQPLLRLGLPQGRHPGVSVPAAMGRARPAPPGRRSCGAGGGSSSSSSSPIP